jgi:hypothetical protein
MSAGKGVAFPSDLGARRQWQAGQLPAPPVVPDPEHTSRDPFPYGDPDRIPRALGVTQLRSFAEAHGWTVAVTYARGPWLSAKGVPAYLAHSLAVRGSLGDKRFHALYIRPVVEPDSGARWTCDHAMLIPIDPPGIFPHASVNDLKEWIMCGGVVSIEWYEAIRLRLAEQKAKTQAAAKARPKKAKGEHA